MSLILLMFGFCPSLQAQSDVLEGDTNNIVLLVRLKTEHKRIESLEQGGYQQEASKLRSKVIAENENTVSAFLNSITCCKVFYFYDTSSAEIRDGNFEYLMSYRLDTPVGKTWQDSAYLYIAEFGSPVSETFGTESGFGLVVYDKKFKQMAKPFPYYVSNVYGIISRKEVVSRFNTRLLKLIESSR